MEKGKKLERFKKIMNDTSIRVNTIISCGIPRKKKENERADFIKGILILQSNGKNDVQEELIELHHTWKSPG